VPGGCGVPLFAARTSNIFRGESSSPVSQSCGGARLGEGARAEVIESGDKMVELAPELPEGVLLSDLSMVVDRVFVELRCLRES
jgi:hypothetical protein